MSSRAATVVPQPFCRLCGGMTAHAFSGTVLGKYMVQYWRCEHCQSLQTDEPFWLTESYRNVHSATDTGIVARTWQMARSTSLLLRLAGAGPDTVCLDWGGGNGLFCRMLRDQGYDFYTDDKYADPFYCQGFTRQQCDDLPIDVVTSFEVFEHLATPAIDLNRIRALKPKLWIFSTQLYSQQNANWKYLAQDTGRHVFFYSTNALFEFASANDYQFFCGREMHMFVRKANNDLLQKLVPRKAVQKLLLGDKLMATLAMLNFVGRQRDAHQYWQSDRAHIKRNLFGKGVA